jgi:hypothetical protein
VRNSIQEGNVKMRYTSVDIVACVVKTIRTVTSELRESKTLETLAV